MSALSCNSCNKEFKDDSEQRLHYKSEWHRYNLKRKIAGVPGVTEALFIARQAALDQDKDKSSVTPMLYGCGLCGKEYKSAKAHDQHLKSRSHILRAAQGASQDDEKAIIKPVPLRVANKAPDQRRARNEVDEESEDEWMEVDPEEAADMLSGLNVDEYESDDDMDEDDDDESDEDLDLTSCFMCDRRHKSIESCLVHLHKRHRFFVPDVEYLKDPEGLLSYLARKVKQELRCLYCNDKCHAFSSLEAVRKHMEAKSHCKVHYGDDDEEEEGELEDFYDYSSSFAEEKGKELVPSGDTGRAVELGIGGSALIITTKSDGEILKKILGSRHFLRYSRQKPRPTNNMAVTAVLASRYKSMGLATVQSKQQMVRLKVLRQMNRSGVEAMRSKIGLKSNVIRDLPKNCPY